MKPLAIHILGLLIITNFSLTAQENIATDTRAKNPSREFRYTNPITRDSSISMRDHCIIKVGEKWYCTGTSNPIWTDY